MRVLGISCDYHDAAAALVVDGELVAAAEEERFTRRKHDASFPVHAIASCLAIGSVDVDDLDAVVLHEKPLLALGRVLAARQRRGPRALGQFVGEAPALLGRNLMVGYRCERALRRLGARRPPRLQYCEHHLSHAAAAFYPSPHPSAAVLTVDGIGEWATATLGHGTGHRIDLLAEQRFPDSLGLLYSLVTLWCGFRVNDGEYKLMGLAPFGEPSARDALEELVELHEDGSVEVAGRTVGWWGGDPRRSRRLAELLGPPRHPGEPLTRHQADLAASVQSIVEDQLVRAATHLHGLTGERALCLAGGVALNCVANGRLLERSPFEELWVQPAAGDAGSAVGAALWWWHDVERRPRELVGTRDRMAGAALGPAFTSAEVEELLVEAGVAHRRVADRAALEREVAERLAGGAIVGWFEGRMEFGPRALGHRSILADARVATVHRDLNERVKGRESFRPFAPAVRWEDAGEWFDLAAPSPYMLTTAQVAAERLRPVGSEPEDFAERARVARSEIPACTHVDGSARVQTVHRETSPAFWGLLRAFRDLTGCPVLLNTSFNVADEPIVCTPEDALATARRAGLDLLVLEDCLIEGDALNEALDEEGARR